MIVSICGPSGSGKSQLAKAVCALLGEKICARVPTDYFLVPNWRPAATYVSEPLTYDWEILDRRLALPIGSTTSTPDFDFELFHRAAEFGGRAFDIRPVMLIDSMRPHPRSNLIVLLSAPEDVRRTRLAARDLEWGTRVQNRQHRLDLTWDAARAEIESFDLEFDGQRSPIENAETIAPYITERIQFG